MNAKKTSLFHHEEPCMKKNGEEGLDLPVGCHDGTFFLNKLSPISNISSDQSILNSCIPMYKEALTKSGLNDDIIYNPVIESNNSKRNKARK